MKKTKPTADTTRIKVPTLKCPSCKLTLLYLEYAAATNEWGQCALNTGNWTPLRTEVLEATYFCPYCHKTLEA